MPIHVESNTDTETITFTAGWTNAAVVVVHALDPSEPSSPSSPGVPTTPGGPASESGEHCPKQDGYTFGKISVDVVSQLILEAPQQLTCKLKRLQDT